MVNEKFLVNGKAMTNEEYIALLKTAREAMTAYKETPQYKKEQEVKAKADAEVEANVKKFEDLAKSLKVSDLGIAKIALVIYNKYRARKEK